MEEKVKNNYALGIIGALIGAFIGAVPWVLMYVFANMMYSILAILIVLCSFYGYKLTKAKIDKKLPVILSISSFISITVTMFVIIPICLMAQEGLPVSIENLQLLYQYEEFTSAVLTDYVISILFCLLVIGGIIFNLNKQIKEGKDSKDIKLMVQDASNEQFSNEDIEKVRNIFDKNDAMNKNHTITRELILEDLNREFGEDKAGRIFDYLKTEQIIKKKSNKYYFSEKAQKSAWYRYGVTSIRTFVIVMVIALILACIIIFTEDNNTNNNLGELQNGVLADATNQNEFQNSVLSDTTRDNIYDIGVDNISLEFPSDIIMLTENEITYYFGETYANIYDCLAMNSDFSKMVMIFTDYKANYEEEYTPEEYLKMALDDENIEVNEQEISGHTFYSVERTYEEYGNTYIEQDYIYDAEDRFICMVFDSLETDKIDVSEIIK